MKLSKRTLVPCLLLAILTMLLLSTGAEASVAKSTINTAKTGNNACGGWSVVSSPNVGGAGDSDFASVAAISTNDVWAVGTSIDKVSSVDATLTEHWDGTQWSIVASPNVGSFNNTLLGVGGAASNNVWAVGFFDGSNNVAQTLIENWNGSSWNVVSSPNVGASYNILNSVTAISVNDVWAVGDYQDASSGSFHTLTEHWNGSQWSVVSSPNPGTSNNLLYSVKAVASNNVWAVGQALGTSTPDQTLIEQWNGSSWNVVSSQSTSVSSTLYGVAATSTNAWAVGQLASNTTGSQTLAQQTVKGKWQTVSTPSVGTGDNILYGTVATSDSNVWAAGTFINSSGNNQTLIEQWNGSSWSIATSPNPGSGSNILGGMAATSANDVWAVGGFDNGKSTMTLVEHFC